MLARGLRELSLLGWVYTCSAASAVVVDHFSTFVFASGTCYVESKSTEERGLTQAVGSETLIAVVPVENPTLLHGMRRVSGECTSSWVFAM